MQGKTLDIAKGMPPINLYINKKVNSDSLNFNPKFLNRSKNFSLIISFKK